jgi:hypothetical protein
MTLQRGSADATPAALYWRAWRVRRRLARRGWCGVCKAMFAGKRRDARYCRAACRQRAWRARAAALAAKARRDAEWAAALIG